ncbi:VirB3 family type IV secretion system protein [Maritalea sp.]|uniref:VirB3 family type IV secretion system protein n=1 Tax=Maritalea sp. TaxID=2003361 RepID=UPI003EF7B376
MEDETTLRVAAWRRSLVRHATVLGAERAPALLVLLMGLMLILGGISIITTILGILIILVGLGGLREAAKHHPQATEVYRRSLQYKSFYPARRTYKPTHPYSLAAKKGRRPA